MALETHMKLCGTEPDFSRKIFFAPKIGKMGQKQGFLNLLENLVINFFLNLVYKESSYYSLYSCIFELFEHWTMLIVFLFLALILSIWLTIKPSNLIKFYSQISENWSNFHLCKGSYKIKLPKGPIKISPVGLSICLSVRPSVTHFSQDLLSGFS